MARDDHEQIVQASIAGDQLVLTSATFDELRVPLALLRTVQKGPVAAWRQFELDLYGEYLVWPRLDVHMGWSQLEQLVDPEARLRAAQRSDRFNGRYGAAIRASREAAGLRQRDVPGLSDRTLRRLEAGRTRATTNALRKLAAARGLELNEYLGRLARMLEDGGAT